ncbi:uncharacterized protein LOC112165683 isoform X2 [Rosa chinensis]|uniref:uncharacterized protein LOC112165683 isoform X2 n=1 Tax=Rosa chinensis TaxID=74649 RepID=UPI001AD8A4F3|nr:uncharacterized protein LOC112165683 isoform X2 [Rosa chinensis]
MNPNSCQNYMDVFIHEMEPYKSEYKIRVRISRVWRAKKYNTNKDDGLHSVLIDEKGDAIHAIINESDYPLVHKKIQQGKVYDIHKFFTRKNQENFKILDHQSQVRFNAMTIFEAVEGNCPEIPEQRFYLVEFDQLKARMNDNTILTDLYGCLKSIVPPHETTVKHKESKCERQESKCEIHLQNLKREDLRITLWGNTARQVDMETIRKTSPPVLMALTSLKIKEYLDKPAPSNTSNTCIFINPYIPETNKYRLQFSKLVDRVQILPTPFKQPTSEEIQETDMKTVTELNILDPLSYKEQMVYCNGSISRFATHDGWWYKGCPRCYRELKEQEHDNQLGCSLHGKQEILPCFRVYMTITDDQNDAAVIIMGKPAEQLFGSSCKDLVSKRSYPTEATLPEEIEKTRGQKFLFQLKIKDDGELIIKDIFPHMESSVAPFENDPATMTPDPVPFQKRRAAGTSKKGLFISEPNKKSRSTIFYLL